MQTRKDLFEQINQLDYENDVYNHRNNELYNRNIDLKK